jgi:NAD(P)-dependent dehydrogenase (short-subunit alcohol dehydrogenase family)
MDSRRSSAQNHLGHFVLVNRIAPLMRASSRLINLSSAGHRFANVNLDDPGFERTPYEPFAAYGRSKTANILFAVAFTGGIGSAACGPPPSIREAYEPNLAATSTQATCKR